MTSHPLWVLEKHLKIEAEKPEFVMKSNGTFLDGSGLTDTDLVNSPPHYTVGGYEALDIIKAKLTRAEYIGYCKGNILKYVMRSNYKGHHDQDLLKATFYSEEIKDALQIRDEDWPVLKEPRDRLQV